MTRLWARVDKNGPQQWYMESQCWLWTGARSGDGYGHMCVGSKPEGTHRTVKVHRLVYGWDIGPIPLGGIIMHRCDTPFCVRPGRLRAGITADNIADKFAKGRDYKQGPVPDDVVRAIRASYGPRNKGGLSSPKLAERFGISKEVVLLIVKRRTYKHVA